MDKVGFGRSHEIGRAVGFGWIVGLDEVKPLVAAAVEVVLLVAVPMEERYAGPEVLAAVGIAGDSEGSSGDLFAVQENRDRTENSPVSESGLFFLDGVLRMINSRTYHIKNAIEWKRFQSGM